MHVNFVINFLIIKFLKLPKNNIYVKKTLKNVNIQIVKKSKKYQYLRWDSYLK